MFSVIIHEKGGQPRHQEFTQDQLTIGRVQGNNIILPKQNVSKRHSRIVVKDGKFIIVDLKSTNGTYVNGRKIASPMVVKPTDKIYIGDFILSLDPKDGGETTAGLPRPPSRGMKPAPPPPPRPLPAHQPPPAPKPMAPPIGGRGGPRSLPNRSAPAFPEPRPNPRPLSAQPPAIAPPAAPAPLFPDPQPVPKPISVQPSAIVPPAPLFPDPQAKAGPRPLSAPPAPVPEPPSPFGPPIAPAPPPAPPKPLRPPAAPQPAPPTPLPAPVAPEMAPPERSSRALPKAPKRKSAPVPAFKPPSLAPKPPAPVVEPPAPPATPASEFQDPPSAKSPLTQSPEAQILESLSSFLQKQGGDPDRYRPEAWDELTKKRAFKLAVERGQALKLEDPEHQAALFVAEALELGPLTALMKEEGVEQIQVNAPDQVFVLREDRQEQHSAHFSGQEGLLHVISRLMNSAGCIIKEGAGWAEGVLPDGSHLYAILPPLGGPYLNIRRSLSKVQDLQDLVKAGVLSTQMAAFLEQAIHVGKNLLVSANDLGARLDFIKALLQSGAQDLRVICIEAGGRLSSSKLKNQLNLSAAPGIGKEFLVQQALKMSPERLVVADCSGPGTFQALSALTAGVNGGILGINAESPDDALIRFLRQSSLSIQADDAQLEAQIKETLDVLVQVLRYADGSVCVTQILDIDGETQEVFTGLGDFVATGHVPRWVQNAQSLGHPVDMNLFH